MRTEEESIARELEEFIEEYSGDDGLLEGATSDAGKVTQAAVRARLKAVVVDPEGQEERDVLEVCLDLMKALAAAKGGMRSRCRSSRVKLRTTGRRSRGTWSGWGCRYESAVRMVHRRVRAERH